MTEEALNFKIISIQEIEFYSFTHNNMRLLDFFRGMGVEVDIEDNDAFRSYKVIVRDPFQIDRLNKFISEIS